MFVCFHVQRWISWTFLQQNRQVFLQKSSNIFPCKSLQLWKKKQGWLLWRDKLTYFVQLPQWMKLLVSGSFSVFTSQKNAKIYFQPKNLILTHLKIFEQLKSTLTKVYSSRVYLKFTLLYSNFHADEASRACMIRKNNSHSNVVISINHILHDQLLKKSEKLLLKRYFCSNSQFNLLTCICMV